MHSSVAIVESDWNIYVQLFSNSLYQLLINGIFDDTPDYATCHYPVKLFRRRMQNYATLCDTIIQHYSTLYNPRRYVAAYPPPYRRE